MKSNRFLPILLFGLLLQTSACGVPWARDLPVVSQFLPATSTPSPLPPATPTGLPSATVTPPSSQTPIPATTATTTPVSIPDPTSAATPSATVINSPVPTATLAPAPPPSTTALEIGRGDPARPWIALTFDAGSDISPLPSIVDTLRQKDVRCTFFVTGIMLRQPTGPELLQQIVDNGHELGNHSDTHPRFTELTDAQIAVELATVEEWAVELTGQSTKPYFRPPFGNRDDRVRWQVKENGYLTIYWTYHVWDWTADRTREKILKSSIEGARNGAIVVMHVGAQETADVLPTVIDELRARGYRLVTLSELLAP